MSLFKRKKAPTPEAPVIKPTISVYDFIVKCEDEKANKALTKYQKFWTDPEEKYDGMTMKELKGSDLYGEKVYEFPPLDVEVKLSAFIAEDGSVTISGYVLDGDNEILVGTAAKTKAKKILKILQEESPAISGELYGGRYWKLEDSGYVDDRWSETITLRVFLQW